MKVVTSIDYEEMEPVIQIELNEENVGEEDVRREAVQYVQDNYKDIEKKMKGHKKGEDNLFKICSSIQGLKTGLLIVEKLRDEWSTEGPHPKRMLTFSIACYSQVYPYYIISGRMEIIFEEPEFIDIVTYQKDGLDDEEVNEEFKTE